MGTIVHFKTPDWIQTREPVAGDLLQGNVVTEGVANRPSRNIFAMELALRDIALTNKIYQVVELSIGDAQTKGSSSITLEKNSAYLLNPEGRFLLHLPIDDLEVNDCVRIKLKTGKVSDTNTVRITGKSDKGFQINYDNYVDLSPKLDLLFDYVFVFNGAFWESRSMTGGSGSITTTQEATTAGSDDYIIVHTPDPFRMTLKNLMTYIEKNFTRATQQVEGIQRVATDSELRAGKLDNLTVSPRSLRVELPKFITEWFNMDLEHGKHGSIVYFNPNGKGYSDSPLSLGTLVEVYPIITSDDDKKYLKVPSFDIRDGKEYSYNAGAKAWLPTNKKVSLKVGVIYLTPETGRAVYQYEPGKYMELGVNSKFASNTLVSNEFKLNKHPLNLGKLDLTPADLGTMTKEEIKSYIKDVLNSPSGDGAIPGSSRWSKGRLYSWNGTEWIQIWPAQWG